MYVGGGRGGGGGGGGGSHMKGGCIRRSGRNTLERLEGLL